MKTILFSLIVVFFISCNKDGDEANEPLNHSASIKVTGAKEYTKARANSNEVYSIDSIIRLTMEMSMKGNGILISGESMRMISTGDFYYRDRDTVNNRFLFFGGDVIKDGELGGLVTDRKDIVFTFWFDKDGNIIDPKNQIGDNFIRYSRIDTVAYIPNSVVIKAREAIVPAFNRQDYRECYRLFDEAFIFIPTTGPKWREMKAAGIE